MCVSMLLKVDLGWISVRWSLLLQEGNFSSSPLFVQCCVCVCACCVCTLLGQSDQLEPMKLWRVQRVEKLFVLAQICLYTYVDTYVRDPLRSLNESYVYLFVCWFISLFAQILALFVALCTWALWALLSSLFMMFSGIISYMTYHANNLYSGEKQQQLMSISWVTVSVWCSPATLVHYIWCYFGCMS